MTGHLDAEVMHTVDRKVAVALLASSFLFLVALASGHLYSSDGLAYFRAAEDLLVRRSWVFDPPLVWGGVFRVPITPIGLSLAYWPALLLALPLLPFQPTYPSPTSGHLYNLALFYADPVYMARSWVNPLISAGTVVASASLATRLGFSQRIAIIVWLSAVCSRVHSSSMPGRTSCSPLAGSYWSPRCTAP